MSYKSDRGIDILDFTIYYDVSVTAGVDILPQNVSSIRRDGGTFFVVDLTVPVAGAALTFSLWDDDGSGPVLIVGGQSEALGPDHYLQSGFQLFTGQEFNIRLDSNMTASTITILEVPAVPTVGPGGD